MDAIKGMIPGMGGDEESPEEKERQRKEAIMQAEKERRKFYKKQEEDRDTERQVYRDKVSTKGLLKLDTLLRNFTYILVYDRKRWT